MRASLTSFAALAIVAAVSATPASADCKRYGFSVNDYGKEGPTRDAKELLDKHIATKMAERGIKTYNTGKKDVSCELFLNFIVFDEHTCTAEATVCWGGTPLPAGQQVTGADQAAPNATNTTGSISKPDAKKSAKTKPEPGSAKSAAKTPAAPAEPAPAPESAPAAPAAEPASPAPAPAATTATAPAEPAAPAAPQAAPETAPQESTEAPAATPESDGAPAESGEVEPVTPAAP